MYHWQEYKGAGEALLLPLADSRGYLPEPGDSYTQFDYSWPARNPDWLWADYIARCEEARRKAQTLLDEARRWVAERQAYWSAIDRHHRSRRRA
jgi:hypothetical protein